MATGEPGTHGRDHDGPERAAARPSGWRINWFGIVPLAIVAVAGVVAWRALAPGDDSISTAPATTTETTAATPTTVTVPVAVATEAPAPVTTAAASTTVAAAAPPGPSIDASGVIAPCRFGDSCLIVSFTVDGFDPAPTEFTCVYPNSRSTFSFNGQGVLEGCKSGDDGDVISIEVAGLRSADVSAETLTPGPAAIPADSPG